MATALYYNYSEQDIANREAIFEKVCTDAGCGLYAPFRYNESYDDFVYFIEQDIETLAPLILFIHNRDASMTCLVPKLIELRDRPIYAIFYSDGGVIPPVNFQKHSRIKHIKARFPTEFIEGNLHFRLLVDAVKAACDNDESSFDAIDINCEIDIPAHVLTVWSAIDTAIDSALFANPINCSALSKYRSALQQLYVVKDVEAGFNLIMDQSLTHANKWAITATPGVEEFKRLQVEIVNGTLDQLSPEDLSNLLQNAREGYGVISTLCS